MEATCSAPSGGTLATIDLDEPSYFAEEDLAAYALASLQLAGDEQARSPYNDTTVAGPVAAHIAALSQQNFLIAGLIARAHGLHDEHAIAPGQLGFEATVEAALATYLQQLQPLGPLPASQALTALAFAEAPGLPEELWQVAIQALCGTRIAADEFVRFVRSSAANFLVEASQNPVPEIYGRDAEHRVQVVPPSAERRAAA